ncbi:MAG: PQQ-dependent sugar dehydrogenase [Rubrivivax sp.]|nr:PQQ-dependent sugar dehydrogenase [Rubrivivax sp.]
MKPHRILALLACMVIPALTPALADTLDTRLIASGLSQPLYATSPLAGGPVYVVEKGGAIKAVQGGVASNFLNIAVSSSGEQGLLGLAFDPGYADPTSAGYRRFFVNYIDAVNQDTVVASYRSSADPLLADAASRVEVMRFDQPNGLSNHKAGWLGFKPGDANHLYIATGDGGSSNDPSNNAQNAGVLLGKMLRIDINGDDFASPDINYAVPTDNPFYGIAGTRGEIFALGLRNPWRNSFDRLSGDLWIADVGQNAREEVNLVLASSPGGQNFGWRVREGDIATPGVGGPLQPGMVDPLLVYPRSFGASITGGYVVREAGSPLYGQYVFGDFVSGRIWSVLADGNPKTMADATEWTAMLDAGAGGALSNISSFGEGPGGELYIVDYAGKVVQVVPEPASAALMLSGALLLLAWLRRSLALQR